MEIIKMLLSKYVKSSNYVQAVFQTIFKDIKTWHKIYNMNQL